RSEESFAMFFFFQAEDGIRDGHVTGVQTCAFRSLSTGQFVETDRPDPHPDEPLHGHLDRAEHSPELPLPSLSERGAVPRKWRRRSEERRVGKEGRSRCAEGRGEKKTKRAKEEADD